MHACNYNRQHKFCLYSALRFDVVIVVMFATAACVLPLVVCSYSYNAWMPSTRACLYQCTVLYQLKHVSIIIMRSACVANHVSGSACMHELKTNEVVPIIQLPVRLNACMTLCVCMIIITIAVKSTKLAIKVG